MLRTSFTCGRIQNQRVDVRTVRLKKLFTMQTLPEVVWRKLRQPGWL